MGTATSTGATKHIIDFRTSPRGKRLSWERWYNASFLAPDAIEADIKAALVNVYPKFVLIHWHGTGTTVAQDAALRALSAAGIRTATTRDSFGKGIFIPEGALEKLIAALASPEEA